MDVGVELAMGGGGVGPRALSLVTMIAMMNF